MRLKRNETQIADAKNNFFRRNAAFGRKKDAFENKKDGNKR